MPMETEKEVNTKGDLVKVSADIVEHLLELVNDLGYVLPAPGQASLLESAKTALDRMAGVANQLALMPESDFESIPEEEMKKKMEARKQKEKLAAEREKEKEKEEHKPPEPSKGTPDAKGHQSRQHV